MRQIVLTFTILLTFIAIDGHAQQPTNDAIHTGEKIARAGECDYYTQPTSPDSAKALIKRVKECDPLGDYFQLNGKIRKNHYGFHDTDGYAPESEGFVMLKNMQTASRKFDWVDDAFTGLPMMDRRAVAEAAMPLLADFMVEYLHEDHLQNWLLKLDWSEDIAPINPQWYEGVDWPTDKSKPVSIDGFDQKLSKIDLWVRMWWLRRGEGLFRMAKEAVSKRVEKEVKG
jgi:hypothetical protein